MKFILEAVIPYLNYDTNRVEIALASPSIPTHEGRVEWMEDLFAGVHAVTSPDKLPQFEIDIAYIRKHELEGHSKAGQDIEARMAVIIDEQTGKAARIEMWPDERTSDETLLRIIDAVDDPSEGDLKARARVLKRLGR